MGAVDFLQSKSQEFNFTLGNKLSLMAELSEHEETKTKSINQLLTFFENFNEIENNFPDFVISEQKKYCCNHFYNNEQMLKDSLGFFAEKLNEIEESEEADLRKKLENLFRFPVYLPKFKTDSSKLFDLSKSLEKENILSKFGLFSVVMAISCAVGTGIGFIIQKYKFLNIRNYINYGVPICMMVLMGCLCNCLGRRKKFKEDLKKITEWYKKNSIKILRDVTLNSYKKYKEEVLETFPTILNESIKKDFQEIRDLINN